MKAAAGSRAERPDWLTRTVLGLSDWGNAALNGNRQMRYRDELIRRLQHEGSWQSMTVHNQSRFRQPSEDQARQIMVLEDQWTLCEPDAVNLIGLVSLVRMIQSFKAALVEVDGENMGQLAKPGMLLAEFVIELSNRGLNSQELEEGLSQMSPLVIASLITSYKLTR
jgi:hypothetical protein